MLHFRFKPPFTKPYITKPAANRRRTPKFLAVLSLLTVIAASSIIAPAQSSRTSTASPKAFASVVAAETSGFFSWIYGSIFSGAENKAADEEAAKTPSTSAVKADFEDFTPGTVNGQKNWKSSGSGAYGNGFDVEVTDNDSNAPKSFGSRSLRLSNAYTSDSLAEQTFAGLLPNEGGETSADNLGEKRGERMRLFTSEWEFASANPNSEQYGLSVVASPTRRDGSQMSYVRMVDTPEGIAVFFKDYRSGTGFSEINIANGLDRTQAHKIRLDISFNEGAGNDNVSVYVDNELKHQGTTWENFYRENGKSQPPTVDTISFNTDGSAYPANRGEGFLFDNVMLSMMVSPSVVSISRLTPTDAITNASTVVFRVVFDVAVTGVDYLGAGNDFVITKTGGITGESITNINVSGGQTIYDVTVTGYSGDGTLRLDVVDNETIFSVTGSNPLGGPGPNNGNFNTGQVYTIDNTFPTVSSINRANPNPTNASTVQFTVTFSENVTGVGTGDFSLVSIGGVTGSINSVTPVNAQTYTVVVTGVSGNGTLGLNLVDDDSITDFVAPTPYRLGGTGTGNGNFTGAVYTVDNIAPSVAITPASGSYTTSPISFTATFNESVNGFISTDVIVTGGSITPGSFTGVDGNLAYPFTITPTGDGTITVNIAAGVANDLATNPNTAATQASVNYDGTVPTVAVTYSPNPTNASPINFVVTFSENVTGFGDIPADYIVTNGTVGTITGGPMIYTVPVTPMADGAVTFKVNAGAAADSGPNQNTASNNLSITSDRTDPTVAVSYSPNPTNSSPINFVVTFSESVTGFGNVPADYTITNGTVGTITGTGANYIVPVTPSANGAVTLQVNANAAADAATNQNSVSNNLSITYDTVAPTVTVGHLGTNPTMLSPITFTFTLSEPVVGGLTNANITAGNGTKSNFTTLSPISYKVDITPLADGAVTATVAIGAITDAAGNSNTAAGSDSVTFDDTDATVTITPTAAGNVSTGTSPVNFTVVFSEPVTGFTASGVTVRNTSTAFTTGTPSVTVTANNPPNNGTSYNVAVSGMNQTGTVIISVAAGAAMDSSNNPNAASTTDGTITFNLPNTTVLVTPVDTMTWAFFQETPGVASGSLVTGPATPPLGTGSARLTVDTAAGMAFGRAGYSGTKLSDITQLSYSTYQTSGAPSVAIAFQFDVDSDLSDGNTGYQGRLVYEPSNDPANTDFSGWKNWNALSPTARFWGSGSGASRPFSVACPQTAPCTKAFILANFPNIGIRNGASGTSGFILFKIGAGVSPAFDGNVDNLVLGVNSVNTTFNFDETPPTVSIDNISVTEGNAGTTTASFTVTQSAISQLDTTFTVNTADVSATAGSDYVAIINQTFTIPASQTTVTVPVTVNGDTIVEGNETFNVNLTNAVNAAIADGQGVGTINNDDVSVTIEQVGPDPTNSSPINFTVVFSEAVTGFITGDVTLSGTAGATTAVVTGGPTTYNVAVSGMTADGTVIASIPAGAANGAFAANVASTSVDNVVTYDTVAPTVTVGHLGTNPTMLSPITFTFTLSEPVVGGLTNANITAGNGTKSNFTTLSPISYKVDITPLADGAVTATVAIGAITDAAGNSNTAAGSDSVTFDDTDATVTITPTAAGNVSTGTSPVNFTVVFSEPVTGFTASGVTVRNTSTAFTTGTPSVTVTANNPPNNGTSYNVAVSGMNQTGTVIISVAAGAAMDSSNNPNAASTTDGTITFNLPNTTVLVTPVDTMTWAFFQETPGVASGSLVTGPATPPLGTGSARLTVDTAAGMAFGRAGYSGTKLSDITQLSYSTYQTSGAPSVAIAFQFDVDSDLSDGNTGYQGRLVYEPSNDPANTDFSGWKNWNALSPTARFWGSGSGASRPFSVACPQTAPCTKAFILANFPNIGIRNGASGTSGFILFKIGAGVSPAFDGNVDNLVLGVNSVNTTFNFDETPPTVSIDNTPAVSVIEGDGVTTTTATFTVSLSAASQLDTTVLVNTADVSATAGSDYVGLVNYPVTILAGATSKTLDVTVNGDDVFEPNETFTVSLSNAVNAAIVGSPVTGTITDDEPARTLSIANTTPGAEPGTANVFTVILSGQTALPVTVSYATANGTATAGSDYTATSGMLNFAANTSTLTQTITVATLDDLVFEGSENFRVLLSGATNATITGTNPATGTITDNDSCNYAVTPTGMTFGVAGGGNTFAVTVNQGCAITATSNNGFITVTSVSGNTVNYSVASNAPSSTNSGAPRSGTITVGGTGSNTATFAVMQPDAQAVVVTAPTIAGQLNGADVIVPISVTQTTGRGILAYDFRITYDPTVLQFNSTINQTGTVSQVSGFNLGITNSTPAGTLRVSGFAGDGSTPLSDAGKLFNLRFTVIGVNPQTSSLTFTSPRFNDGNPAVSTVNGSISVVNGTVKGAVTYGVVPISSASPTPTPKPVKDVTVSADGSNVASADFLTTTACNGTYTLSGFDTDSYTVTPTKMNNFNNGAVSSNDAFAVQSFVLGRPNSALSLSQQIVADVSGSGDISSFDAALIQRYVTFSGMPPVSAQINKTGNWTFDPTSKSYTAVQLQANQEDQNYSAILFGDVTGNYNPDDDGCLDPSATSTNENDQLNRTDVAGAPVIVNLPTQGASANATFDIPISVDDVTNLNINSYDLVFSYDPTVLQPQTTATDRNGTLSTNFSVSSASAGTGRLRVSGFSSDGEPLTGNGALIKLKFRAVGAAGSSSTLSFTTFRFNEGTPTNAFSNGQFTVFSPTSSAASISGRVRSSAGKPAGGVTVTLTDSNGIARSVRTSLKGLYRFDEVPTGGTYTIAVSDKFTSGAPQVITLVGDLSALDLIF